MLLRCVALATRRREGRGGRNLNRSRLSLVEHTDSLTACDCGKGRGAPLATSSLPNLHECVSTDPIPAWLRPYRPVNTAHEIGVLKVRPLSPPPPPFVTHVPDFWQEAILTHGKPTSDGMTSCAYGILFDQTANTVRSRRGLGVGGRC